MKLLKKAIVIIHGFTGSLYENEYLANLLEYENDFDVFAKTLTGHNHDRFSSAKYEDWLKDVDNEIKELINHGYNKIYLVGHSMGGILASYLASRYKQVKKLVLINAAFDWINFKQNKDDFLKKDTSKYSHLWEKFLRTSPLMVYEFSQLVKTQQNVLKNITCEVLILQSNKDEIIPIKTANKIYEKLEKTKNKKITYLDKCSHVVLIGDRKDEVSKYIRSFLRGGITWKINMKDKL